MDLKTLSDTPPWDWPTDAGETLLSALRDDAADDSERRLAAEMAGNHIVMNDDMAEALLAVVRSPEEGQELRGTAAIALGPILEHLGVYGFDDPEDVLVSERVSGAIRDSLREVYLDAEVPKEVRRRVLEASVRRQEDWHPGAVHTWNSRIGAPNCGSKPVLWLTYGLLTQTMPAQHNTDRRCTTLITLAGLEPATY